MLVFSSFLRLSGLVINRIHKRLYMIVDRLAWRLVVFENSPRFVLRNKIMHAEPEKSIHSLKNLF